MNDGEYYFVWFAVVGWETEELRVTEGDRGVSVEVGLVKGDQSVLPAVIRFTPMEDMGSATSMLRQ